MLRPRNHQHFAICGDLIFLQQHQGLDGIALVVQFLLQVREPIAAGVVNAALAVAIHKIDRLLSHQDADQSVGYAFFVGGLRLEVPGS